MVSVIKNIFGKKTQSNESIPPFEPLDNKREEKPLEKNEEVFTPKSMKKITRGPDGKFISKKRPAKKAEENIHPEEPKKEVQPEQAPAVIESTSKDGENKQITSSYQVLTFYSKDIRRAYREGVWYFALEDILYIASIDDPESFLVSLKEKPSIKKTLEDAVTKINFLDEEGEKTVNCITYDGFMTLLPVIRENGYMLPGPFPDWLKDISQFPLTP